MSPQTLEMSYETRFSATGNKRRCKPKNSNAIGSRRMLTDRMDVEDDDLDRSDFVKISKSRRPSSKTVEKRRRLSSVQKTAMEEITVFPEMSPKTIMAESAGRYS